MTTFTATIDTYAVTIGVNVDNHGGSLPREVREEIELRTFCGQGEGVVQHWGCRFTWSVITPA